MSSSIRRRALRAGILSLVAGGALLAAATPALAHVTAQPAQAEQGDYAVIALRVPTESDSAGTVKLQVTLSTDTPISSVRTTPRPGWTATLTKVALNPPVERNGRTLTEAIGTVTWTAGPGTRIGPGEFADFPLSLGPLPEVDRLVLPAVQTYDDGEVVAWDQALTPDGAEPERPAPSVSLSPAAAAPGEPAAPPLAAVQPSVPAASPADPTARWLGGAGLLLGALGLGLGAGSLLRHRTAAKS